MIEKSYQQKVTIQEISKKITYNSEMAKIIGYDRIWDCWLIKYIWSKD